MIRLIRLIIDEIEVETRERACIICLRNASLQEDCQAQVDNINKRPVSLLGWVEMKTVTAQCCFDTIIVGSDA